MRTYFRELRSGDPERMERACHAALALAKGLVEALEGAVHRPAEAPEDLKLPRTPPWTKDALTPGELAEWMREELRRTSALLHTHLDALRPLLAEAEELLKRGRVHEFYADEARAGGAAPLLAEALTLLDGALAAWAQAFTLLHLLYGTGLHTRLRLPWEPK